MKQYIIFTLLLIYCGLSLGFIEYTALNYPNPTKEFGLCGRQTESWICDPDTIIDLNTANEINSILNYIHEEVPSDCKDGGYQVAVALMSKLHVPSTTTVEEQAKKMAKELHDLWQVGHLNCNNGILFLLSKEDRRIYISTGSGVKNVLTDQLIDNIIEKMKSGLRNGEYSVTIKEAIIDIKQVLSGNTTHLSNDESVFAVLFSFLLISAPLICICCTVDKKKRDCRHKLSLIERQAKAKKFTSIMCPICLEEFDNLPKKEILDCGHTFCKQCISKWQKNNNSCPICRSVQSDSPPTQYNKELHFHLNSLSILYPDYVTHTMVNTWTTTDYSGNFTIYEGASASFGGGDSSSGGGSGGGW